MTTEIRTEQSPADVSKMTASQIIELFAWYNFTDEHGHSLTKCLDFTALVERATGEFMGLVP